MLLLSQLINGVQIGSIYALVALGYSMVYGIIMLINFAHGDIIMVGSYCVWYAMARQGAHPVPAVLFAVVFCAVLGMVIEKVAYKPLRNSARLSLLITAIGISLLLQNLMQLIFSATPRMFTNFFPGSIALGGLRISVVTLVTIGVSVVMMLGLTVLVTRTRAGKAMRAVSEDNETSQLMGINVNRTISFTFSSARRSRRSPRCFTAAPTRRSSPRWATCWA